MTLLMLGLEFLEQLYWMEDNFQQINLLTLKDIRAVYAYRVRSSWVQGTTHTRVAFTAT